MPTSRPSKESTITRLSHSYWLTPTLSASEQIRLIDEVARESSFNAIPVLLKFALAADRSIAFSAAKAMESVIRSCSAHQLAQLDLVVRKEVDWHSLGLQKDLTRLSSLTMSVPQVVSFHPNGYMRQRATELLAGATDGSELPFLLLRLNDWVTEVRHVASKAVLERVRPEYAPHFAHCLPLIFRLKGQRREDHRQVVHSVIELLQSPSCRHALIDTLSSKDRAVRRFGFGLLVEAAEAPAGLVERGLNSADEVVRLRAANFAKERLPQQMLEPMLPRILADRFTPVRREAVYGYVERLPQHAPDVLQALLLDRRTSMREIARFYLRQRREIDYAAFYRTQLLNAPRELKAAAVAGLGETGTANNIGDIEPLLSDHDHRVRRAAIRALGRLDTEGHAVDHALQLLADPSPAVSKAARKVLLAHACMITPKALWRIFIESAYARETVLSLIANLGWWDSAPLLLMAAGIGGDSIPRKALDCFRRWRSHLNRLSARASQDQLRLLEQAFLDHHSMLDMDSQKDVEAHLAYAKREWSGNSNQS